HFFFQAEDGIRDFHVTGVQTCALPISGDFNTRVLLAINGNRVNDVVYDSAGLGRTFPIDLDLIERIEFIPGPGGAVYGQNAMFEIGRASCRERVEVQRGGGLSRRKAEW